MDQGTIPLTPRYRVATKGWALISIVLPGVALIAALLYLFHLRPFGFVLIDVTYLYILLAGLLPLCFIWIPAGKRVPGDGMPWYDILLFFMSLGIPAYFALHSYDIIGRGWAVVAPPSAMVLGLFLWMVCIEAARRAAGPIFAMVVLVFSAYPLFAGVLPGILWTESFPLRQLVAFHAFSADSIMGIPLHVFGDLFFGYMAYSIVVQMLGAGKFFNTIAQSLLGMSRGGNAKTAIVASALFGTLSGAPVANVMTVGAFTIPAMKREGLPDYFAGAVEACASSGGALMPPVMGAVAFVMAEMLGVPYSDVIVVAVVPSLLYYMTLFVQIDSYAARVKLKPLPIAVEVPPMWRTLVSNLHIILSFFFLIFLIFFMRWEQWAPWLATIAAIVLAMPRKETRLGFRSFLDLLKAVGRVLGELMGIMAPVGMIIGGFVITGLAYSFPDLLVKLGGENIYLMLLLGAVASFILGMGVPITPTYIFLAIVLAPGLVLAGLDLMAVHFFILYAAMMSYITPPVAIAAFAAAAIAGADPMKTGFQAMKLGIAKYILPFIFVLRPALILHGTAMEILTIIPTTIMALIIISGALEGYFWGLGNLRLGARVLLFAAGLLLAFPGLSIGLYGVGVIIVIFGLCRLMRLRKSPVLNWIIKGEL